MKNKYLKVIIEQLREKLTDKTIIGQISATRKTKKGFWFWYGVGPNAWKSFSVNLPPFYISKEDRREFLTELKTIQPLNKFKQTTLADFFGVEQGTISKDIKGELK